LFPSVVGPAAGRVAWDRLLPSWPLIVALAALVPGLAHPDAMLHDPDTYLHITAGRWILAHGSLPAHDPFSYTFAGKAWASPEWLAEIALAAVFGMLGWGGLALLTIACFALSLGLLTRFLLRSCEPFSALIMVGLAAAMLKPHVLARPHVLALPLMVAWSGALFAARDAGTAPPFRLLPIMVLWANLHGSFLFGIALAGFLAGEAALFGAQLPQLRRWGAFLGLALAAGSLTPNGVAGLIEPLRLLTMPALQSSFIEWRAPDFQQFQPVEIGLLGLMAVGLTSGIKLPWPRALLLVLLAHMALAHARHSDLLGLVGPLALAASAGPQLAARIRGSARSWVSGIVAQLTEPTALPAMMLSLALGLVLSLSVLTRPIDRADDLATPSSALAAAARLGLWDHVLNSEGFGGYLVFRGVPSFIDGRIEMFGNTFLQRYLDAANGDATALAELLRRWDVRWTLLAPDQPAVGLLDHLPGWRRVYSDPRAVIHVRG
jgi:hypothetical protein